MLKQANARRWILCAIWGVILSLAVLGSASAQVPALPQTAPGGCTTEVNLYVEKSSSAATRNAARDIIKLLHGTDLSRPVTLPTRVNLYSFAGDVTSSTLAQFDVVPGTPPLILDSALQGATLISPSPATTDLLALFRHLLGNTRPVAPPPLGPTRRFFFVLGDFAHAPLTDAWRAEGPGLLAQLRQAAVANQNVQLIAIQAPPPGPIPPAVQREVTGEIARNFLFFDELSEGLAEIAGLINDSSTRLGLNLSPGGQPNVLLLQVANPTCSRQEQITYRARGETIAPRVLNLMCPPILEPGLGGGPCPIDLNLLRPLAPTTGCVNLWIEAEPGVPTQGFRRGTAPQPIVLGNCAEIVEGVHDLEKQVSRAEPLAPYARLPRPPNPTGVPRQVTGLRLRGHLDAQTADVTWEEVPRRGGPGTELARQRIRAEDFNLDGDHTAFDGALRRLLFTLELPRDVARRLCLEGRRETPKRLRLRINWGNGETSAELLRQYLSGRDLIPHNEWESSLLPVLVLLLIALFVANFLRPAHAGKLAKVLIVLAAGFLLLGFASHFASQLGDLIEESFAIRLELLSTVGVVLIGCCYFALFLMGFFDRRPTAKECLDDVQRRRLKERRSNRVWRTVAALLLIALPLALTVSIIWTLRRNLDECYFSYSSVQAP